MTKIVDNFDLIVNTLFAEPLEEGEFYFVQILVRGKDGNNVNGNNKNRLVRFYVVRSKEKLLEIKPEVIALCRLHNARAYIHMTPREDKAVAAEMLNDAVKEFTVGNFHVFRRLYSTACGRSYSTKKKTFLVDLDGDNGLDFAVEFYKGKVEECRGKDGRKVIATIPTKSGIHLICNPFDVGQFEQLVSKERMPVPDIHKNNPTVLYVESQE